MRSRPRWSTVTIALAVISALAIASPVLGLSKSIKKAIKKEVANQIRNANGPVGSPGPPGTTGANGTARAYGVVNSHFYSACTPNCFLSASKGISTVTRNGTGDYCVHAPGIDPATVPAVASIARAQTNPPFGNATVAVAGVCDMTGFRVTTERHYNIIVRDSANAGTTAAVSPPSASEDVGFTIVIP